MANVPNNMKFYRYVIESFDILFPNESNPTTIDCKQINGITIEKDYDNDYFPVIGLTFSLDQKLYYKILTYKLWVRFRLRIQKYVYNSVKEFQFKKDVINEVFCMFMDENTPFLNKEQQDASKEIDRTTKNPRDMNTEMMIYLFKESDVYNSKKVLNTIISKATLTDIVTYGLSASGFSNVLMTPFDNKNSYDEILLLPITWLENLIMLDQVYGFYSRGSLIFMDTDCMYIIDKNPKCTAYRQQEYTQTVFTIKESTNANGFTPGCLVNASEGKYYINVTPGSISMYNDSVINDHIEGNNVIAVSPNAGITRVLNSNAVQRGGGTYKILVNKYNNQYANDAELTRIKESGNIIHVNLGNFDLDALTPNKEFMFVFEDAKINANFGGNYRITRVNTTLAKSGEEYTVTSSAEFRKYDR